MAKSSSEKVKTRHPTIEGRLFIFVRYALLVGSAMLFTSFNFLADNLKLMKYNLRLIIWLV